MASVSFTERRTALDGNGDPVASAQLSYFQAAAPTAPLEVFADPALVNAFDQPIQADAAGLFPAVYLNPALGDYRVVVANDEGVTIYESEDISPPKSGTVSVAEGGTGSTTPAGARGELGAAAQTSLDALDSRVTAAEGTVAANIDTSTETLTWAPTVGINHASQSTFECTLTGTTAFTISNLRDGGEFELLLIQDATGNRTTTFSGGFVFADEIPRINKTANAQTLIRGKVIGGAVYCKVQAGTPVLAAAFGKKYAGVIPTATAGAWTTLDLDNGTLFDDGTVVSGATSNAFTLPAGEYRIEAWQSIDNTGKFSLRLRDSADTTNYGEGLAVTAFEGMRGGVALLDSMRFVLTAQETFILQYYAEQAGALGSDNSASGQDSLTTYIAVERYS